ncbi:hypothetical protein BJY01DRAFT_218612 [Aspergillus pseudoustus]|uniref:Heterokaryon incompatibility domain-containing protein n=1 Tax=Aspergillus pseudoustus TaxID=1810923 RepID=A0ABR4JJT0_9EURO
MASDRNDQGPLTSARKGQRLAAESGSDAEDVEPMMVDQQLQVLVDAADFSHDDEADEEDDDEEDEDEEDEDEEDEDEEEDEEMEEGEEEAESNSSRSSVMSYREALLNLPARSAPLSRVVVSFLRPPALKQMPWHTLGSLLFLLRFGSAASPYQDPAVVGALDHTQKSVLTLLEEWWMGRDNDAALPKIKRYRFLSALRSAADIEMFNSQLGALKALVFDEDRPFLDAAAIVQELAFSGNPHSRERYLESCDRWENDMRESQKSTYYRNLENLFFAEFHPSAPYAFGSNFSTIREAASGRAALERIGDHAMMHVRSYTEGGSSRPEPPSSILPENPKLKDFSQPIRGTLKPCPWLLDGDADGLPFYLWDIRLGRTIETADISESEIRYAIVSHTWGRLRDGDATENVPGVPWAVPKIITYDVKQIPQIIRDAGFSEPYIWLDLFCIPQGGSDKRQLEICKAELPRQLAIFRNASTAVIWLNDVASLANTAGAVAWLGLKLLTSYAAESLVRYENLDEIEEGLDVAARSASSPCELDLTRDTTALKGEVQKTGLPAWFSSLWTLQEITIRPDMILLDREWRPLAVGNRLLITFDSLLMLVSQASQIDMQDVPQGAVTLISVYQKHLETHLLGSENQLQPLISAAHRVSTCPRAPAIMSAVGATNWFRGQTLQQFESPEEADQLVLGSYPPDFVEEVCDLSGAAFFSCMTNVATMVTHEHNGAEPAPKYPLRGTMLPFMPIPADVHDGFIEPGGHDFRKDDHPSVRSWEIQLDGSVMLPFVALIASNLIELERACTLKCYIRSNDPEDTTKPYGVACEMVLQDWIQKFNGEAHAICTKGSSEQMAGIILHRVKGIDSFVKAGAFGYGWPYTLKEEEDADGDEETGIDPGFITIREVDWRVL